MRRNGTREVNQMTGPAGRVTAATPRITSQTYTAPAHIRIEYSIDYEGVDIRKLSPGTRGIVLLLLYLALDTADYRPLIIDQPEENLDPKSIFDELGPRPIKIPLATNL